MYREVVLSSKTSFGTPEIVVDQNSLVFGEVAIDMTEIKTVKVDNTGDGNLIVTNITSDKTQFTVDKTAFTLPPGGSTNVKVMFKPTAVGDVTGTLTIVNNAGDVQITLSGKGIQGGEVSKPGHVDPSYLQIQSAEKPITVDGVLDEKDWQRRFDHLVFRSHFVPGDVQYAITGEELVKGSYTDTTTTIVKILHHGLDLYISLQSDDKSVCRFGDSWEGDGLFMKINDANGVAVEYKLYFNLAGTDPVIHYEEPGLYPGSGTGAAYKMPGTIVNDTTQVDAGYTAELVIHLANLGYTDPYANVPVMINIFDPDGYPDGAGAWGAIGVFHKTWWGSQWGPDMRVLRLADPPVKNAIKTSDSMVLDGQLTEGFWANADSVVIAKGSNTSSGGYYMQWGNSLNAYTDISTAVVKFAHKGTDLYIGVVSNDSSVCKWSPGWEADGLFLWMTYKGLIPGPTERLEIKAMYFNATQGAGISFETSANLPTGGAEGASYEPAGTVTHTESNGKDAGYSLEVVVHTDLFGYSDGDTVKLSAVIWDMDYASADVFDQNVADYAPHWWGAQWVDPTFEKYYMYREVVLSNLTVGVNDESPTQIVSDFNLEQNYPNPFNPTTNITFKLPIATTVTVAVYDVLGKKLATLVDNQKFATGNHTIKWNGKDNTGNQMSSGVYFYKISSSQFTKTRKMVLMK